MICSHLKGEIAISLNSYLDDIASKLIMKGSEKESIKKSLDVFCDRMWNYFENHESVDLKEIKVFGSYERDTNLPQSVDYKTDVDIMLVLDDDGCTPQTYLDRVRRAIEAKYATSEIKQSSPTIVLQMQHIKFEITPALYDGLYMIKDNDDWLYTFCLLDFDNLTDANKANHYMIKPAIRLIKYWNVNKNCKALSSYEIEKTIVKYYISNHYQGEDTKAYLLIGLKLLRSLSMYDFQRDRLEKAITNIQSAIDDEHDYPTLSEAELTEVISEL